MHLKNFFKLTPLLLAIIIQSTILYSQSATDNWHGFKKVNFKLDTLSAYIVQPKKALEGNPWLWRSYSPDFHIEIDSILVTRGFHLAFLNVNSRKNFMGSQH